ncbi:cilia- and flagella-associated protein 53-like [Diachasma alloeum]|uniref:cilia- and flagella-associated protein 53-like n=1 Tax=Diachasma alloeum TaxID=454923 RepID=UPI0007382496|nr:cilia- and flagella-associated protein 53-like [Diachasma alloeum]
MSILPICSPIARQANIPVRKSQDVVGTANAAIGYRLQERAIGHKIQQQTRTVKGRAVQQHQYGDVNRPVVQHAPETGRNVRPRATGTSIIPTNDERGNDEAMRIEERELQNFIKMREFEERTDKMITLNRIREFVEQGMTAHEEDINIRREKLRHMLEMEDSELMREVVNQVHSSEDAKREEIRIRAEMKKREEEENRRKLITSKRRQQHLENCPETRERISRDIARGVKYSNLIQMLEKETRRKEDRQLDELWYKLMLKENENQRMREKDEMRKRMMVGKTTGLILEQQIAGRSSSAGQVQRLREQEKLELEHLWDEVRAEEVRNLAHEREKRERLKGELEEQLMVARRSIAEQNSQQAEVERMLKVANEEELRKEREEIAKNTEHLRQEMMAYMRSLEDLRVEEAKRAAEVNAIIEESARDAGTRRDLASKRYREGRKRILENFLAERDEQMRLKRESAREEQRRLEEENYCLRKDAEVGAADGRAEAVRRRQMALHYGQQLQAQRQYDEEKKRREVDRDRAVYRDALKENEEYVKLTEEMVNAPEIIAPRAFKIMLKEYSARRDAQQKSLCGHRPVSLPSAPMSLSSVTGLQY